MLTIDTKSGQVKQLLQLKGSTTLFLEAWRGMHLQAAVVLQQENQDNGATSIDRTTLLYFRSVLRPHLYCISRLNKDNLTDQEYRLILRYDIPLGKIFLQCNDSGIIHKKNISVSVTTDERIAACLHVQDPLFYRKHYEYWVGKRKIGEITEFFNEGSLMQL